MVLQSAFVHNKTTPTKQIANTVRIRTLTGWSENTGVSSQAKRSTA